MGDVQLYPGTSDSQPIINDENDEKEAKGMPYLFLSHSVVQTGRSTTTALGVRESGVLYVEGQTPQPAGRPQPVSRRVREVLNPRRLAKR